MDIDTYYLISQYEERRELLEELLIVARFKLDAAIKSKKIKIHSMPGRVKSIDSLLDKIKRTGVEDPFTEIQDLVGLRVVCLLLPDVKKVGDVIRSTFNIIEEEDKINGAAPAAFAYMSLHFTAKLGEMPGYPVLKNLKNVSFEIQVRTIAQDAWASISHHLAYKQEDGIPERWQRNLDAMSALFYVADSHFEFLSNQLLEYRMRTRR